MGGGGEREFSCLADPWCLLRPVGSFLESAKMKALTAGDDDDEEGDEDDEDDEDDDDEDEDDEKVRGMFLQSVHTPSL